MYNALTYQIMLEDIKDNVRQHGIFDDTIGIFVTRPDLPTGKDILSSLEYFHFRTGKSANFYLPGYGAYWPKHDYPDGKVVTVIDGVNWSFSNKMLAKFVSDFEKYSKWQYSGESELLLVEMKNGILSYENMMQFHLDNMFRDGIIDSVHQFFEQVFRICSDKETLNQISNAFGVDKLKQISKTKILENLPLDLGKVFMQEKYFCVKNMNR